MSDTPRTDALANAVENGFAAPIPVSAAKRIADNYGYDQVIIIARKVGSNGSEHVTTYGVDHAHCDAAAKIGDFLKYKIMGWPCQPSHSNANEHGQ